MAFNFNAFGHVYKSTNYKAYYVQTINVKTYHLQKTCIFTYSVWCLNIVLKGPHDAVRLVLPLFLSLCFHLCHRIICEVDRCSGTKKLKIPGWL